MDKYEKIYKYIKNNNLKNLIENDSMDIYFKIERKPENYVRERSGRGRHFYNPKESIMREYRAICKKQLSAEESEFIADAISNYNEFYTIAIRAEYYYPIPVGDSIRLSALKEAGEILPTIRIDLDNYDKFLLDSLHDVLYDDDKHVVSIESKKLYSLNPRTEIHATISKRKISQ